jgi:hypothetical protein
VSTTNEALEPSNTEMFDPPSYVVTIVELPMNNRFPSTGSGASMIDSCIDPAGVRFANASRSLVKKRIVDMECPPMKYLCFMRNFRTNRISEKTRWALTKKVEFNRFRSNCSI